MKTKNKLKVLSAIMFIISILYLSVYWIQNVPSKIFLLCIYVSALVCIIYGGWLVAGEGNKAVKRLREKNNEVNKNDGTML